MDTTTLIKEAKARFSHQESKQYLAEKYRNKLIVINQGGMWKVTVETIAFLQTAPETVVLLDNYENPLKVNSKELMDSMQECFAEVMYSWHEEWLELVKNR